MKMSLTRMWILCMVALLGACGGTDFAGDYEGALTRTVTQTNTSMLSIEKWHINDNNSELQRTWGGGHCVLELQRGCPLGCYARTAEPGGTCVIDDQLYVLEHGIIDLATVGHDVFLVDFSWAREDGTPMALIETGTMVQK